MFSVGIPTVMGWAQAQDEQAVPVLATEQHQTDVVDQGSLTEREAAPVLAKEKEGLRTQEPRLCGTNGDMSG